MTNAHRVTIAVVDDDEAVHDALGNLLASLGPGVETLPRPRKFGQGRLSDGPDGS
jgi:FixJ family two-component response regulator